MKRVEKLLEMLKAQNLDGMLLVNDSNIRYLSGFTGDSSYVIIGEKGCTFITDSRYTEQAEMECKGFEIVNHRLPNLKFEDVIRKICEDKGIKRLGFEKNHVTYDFYERLSKEMPEIEMVGVSGLVEEIRSVKDEDEIKLLRRAAEIADEAFEKILGFIKVGVSEKDIATELQYIIKKLGAEDIAFPSIVASGKRSSLPHGAPTDKLIEDGDFVTLDFGAKYMGYHSDMTRTIVVGKPNSKQMEVYEVVRAAQEAGCRGVKAGLSGKEADAFSRSLIEANGYGPNFGHGLGHGVGLEIHEMPSLSASSEAILKEDNTVTIEPGIYIPDWGGVRIEDTVLVHQDGIETLTKSPKELIIL